MKTGSRLLTLCLAAALCTHVAPAPAADNAVRPTDSLLQQELKQQQIKTTTQRVGTQLEAIIAEFDRNGIQGEDVKVLQAIRTVLDRLSGRDMEKVIQFLQQTRSETDPTASTRNATEAFAGQKAIITQLNQLVLEYQRQQALYEISLRLRELASRQSANMWLGVGLERTVRDKSGFHQYTEGERINLRFQQSEQAPLKEETAAVLKKLEKLSTDDSDGPTADRTRLALGQAKEGGLMPALESSVNELGETSLKLASAIGNEKKARDQMREIARMLILSQDITDALKQAITELDRAMDVQKKVTADTRKTEKKDDADRRGTEQASVADDTDLIRRDVDSLAPIAAEHLKNAVGKMLEARESLERRDEVKPRVERAMPKQEDALTQMREARHALEEQLAKAEELKPENALAALRELQQEVRELVKKEEALKQDTADTKDRTQLPEKAPKQGELKDKAQDLQARAATPSPEAASNLGDAANQMQKAQNSLAQQQNNPAAQQAAIDALQKADEALSKDIARLEQAEKDLAKVEEMQKKLAGIIEDEQKIQSGTAKQAAKKQPDAAASQELAQKQDQTKQDTAALKEEASSPTPAAASHLEDAAREMAAAKSELDKPAPRSALPPEGKALNSLYQAKNEIDKKANELREQLGLPPQDNAAALAEAQKAIEQAQKDVSDAQSNLQQAPPGLLDALQKQQQEIAKALNEARQDSAPSKPLAQAQQSAQDAAQELAQSNLPKAIDSMKAAKNALSQAQQGQPQAQPNGQQAGKPGQQGQPSLNDLAQQQGEVQKAAEALLSQQQAAPEGAMQSASESLQNAANAVGPLAAGALGQLPQGLQSSLQTAQGAASEGSAQSAEGQNTPAQMNAQQAANALAQAQAALALAQAGLGSPSEGQGQGQGKGKGKGQAKGQGEGEGEGQGQGKGKGRSPGQPGPDGNGDGNWAGSGGGTGPRRNEVGAGAFTKLPSRDRAALLQSQAEKYPQEFGPLVEQYLRNLSDQGSQK